MLLRTTLTDVLIDDINQKILLRDNTGYAIVGAALCCLGAALVNFTLACLAAMIAGIGIVIFLDRDKKRRITSLRYDLDPAGSTAFAAFNNLLQQLSQSKLWVINDPIVTALPADSIVRHPTILREELTPFIACNIKPYTLLNASRRLFFLPDCLLVFNAKQYSARSYTSITVSHSTRQVVESGPIPSDCVIVSTRWLYQKKDGGPDKRYKYNRQVPTVAYGVVSIYGSQGALIHLLVSNPNRSKQFVDGLNHLLGRRPSAQQSSSWSEQPPNTGRADGSQANRGSSSNYSSSSRGSSHNARSRQNQPGAGTSSSSGSRQSGTNSNPAPSNPVRSAYEILGVPTTVSRAQLAAAYREKAQLYHPDKVAHVGPEFRELAELKMKEINAAYAQLKNIVQ